MHNAKDTAYGVYETLGGAVKLNFAIPDWKK